jgi:hypothetical protein
MNHSIILSLAFLFSVSLKAETHQLLEAPVRFSKDSEYYASRVGTRYLKFVTENIRFPDGAQKVKFQKALSILEEVMNSEEFKIKVIGYERNGNRSYQKNYLWNEVNSRLSNEQIYETIMNGDEKMRPGTPGEMNFNATVKKCSAWDWATTFVWCNKVVGSTSPRASYWITLNWEFYQSFETHQMVSNMVHEWLHLLGFLHGDQNITQEVPYVVGSIAGQVAKEMLEREQGLY